ncbi:hypothetical protein BZA05DRAFT_413408, partial [Tricharina praecox]|uniref:uncharacterized protein n=1 Tax=Tricharina praecox TaxID=43433 RepID=UPI00221E5EFE
MKSHHDNFTAILISCFLAPATGPGGSAASHLPARLRSRVRFQDSGMRHHSLCTPTFFLLFLLEAIGLQASDASPAFAILLR